MKSSLKKTKPKTMINDGLFDYLFEYLFELHYLWAFASKSCDGKTYCEMSNLCRLGRKILTLNES